MKRLLALLCAALLLMGLVACQTDSQGAASTVSPTASQPATGGDPTPDGSATASVTATQPPSIPPTTTDYMEFPSNTPPPPDDSDLPLSARSAKLRQALLAAKDGPVSGDLLTDFFDYYHASPYELRFLPNFAPDKPPEWSPLTFFIFFFCQPVLDDKDEAVVILQQDVDKAIERLLAPFAYTHQASDFFTYADGKYTATGWDWGGATFYRAKTLARNGDEFTVTFDGYTVDEGDIVGLDLADEPLGANMQALADAAGSRDYAKVVDTARTLLVTGQVEKLTVSEQVTVRFRVSDDEEYAVVYAGCERMVLSTPNP